MVHYTILLKTQKPSSPSLNENTRPKSQRDKEARCLPWEHACSFSLLRENVFRSLFFSGEPTTADTPPPFVRADRPKVEEAPVLMEANKRAHSVQ